MAAVEEGMLQVTPGSSTRRAIVEVTDSTFNGSCPSHLMLILPPLDGVAHANLSFQTGADFLRIFLYEKLGEVSEVVWTVTRPGFIETVVVIVPRLYGA